MGSGSEMGQTFGAYTGGVHWVPGQTKGQPKLSGRRGLYGTGSMVWGPLGWSQNTTKVVVLGLSWWSRAHLCPASVFGGHWGPQQKS